ncbi:MULTISPECIES: Na+/H+ antiporter NhaA [unclassified Frankia]|uniref:Na+/H+ antiporter NhaA n=1 Tax=unclassified Frankia TaxID=2632575 RepID=UPI002AD3BDA1|nr:MULTISPECIES: Na+/H+ antiporter NhaA [unclassified Frankia]
MARRRVTTHSRVPQVLSSRGEFAEFLRQETTGGFLLLGATLIALVWANVAGGTYREVWDAQLGFGPSWLHLNHLSAGALVADGLLAVFFFVAGLELKRELVVGELSDDRAAVLPVVAALGGMVAPALVFLAVARGAPGASNGWAIPVATDIAFALGVLALAGTNLPTSMRVLLLSLAVVDDIGAIILIAVLFTSGLEPVWLGAAVLLLAGYAFAQRRRWTSPLLHIPLALGVWICVHACGIHATVAGIALALLTRVHADPGEGLSPAVRLEHRLHPLSAGLVVPLFALAEAGVPITVTALRAVFEDPVSQGIIAGLVVGKVIGVLGGVWLAVRVGAARLLVGLGWRGVTPIGVLAGIGFTVSLLMSRLALDDFGAQQRAATAVLVASVAASVLAMIVMRLVGRAKPTVRGG